MATTSSNPSTPHAICRVTEDQRYQLCLHKLEHPTLTQAELCTWFHTKYSYPVSQPTISQWLKRSDDILARGPMLSKYELTRVRKRRVRHPELETAVYQWVLEEQQKQLHAFQQRQQQNQRQQMYYLPHRRFRLGKTNTETSTSTTASSSSTPTTATTPFKNAISGPALIRQARRIAKEMHIDDIVFCPGWLARFKARYGVQFGKPSMADRMDSNAITVPNTTSDPTSLSSSTAASPTMQSVGLNEMVDIRASIAVPSSIDTSPPLQLQQVFGHPGLSTDIQTIQTPYQLPDQLQYSPHQQQPQQQQYLGTSLTTHHTPPSTTSTASTNVDIHMRFLNSIPMVPITVSSYTPPPPPSSLAPKHASADIVIPTSDSPLFSGFMGDSSSEEDDIDREYEAEDRYRPSAPTQAEETFTGVMSLQEAQLAVARLRQFAVLQPQGLQGTLHSLDVIEQELGTLSQLELEC
ncbi:hypothetical protein BGZ81_009980 [Podila clonocystis]|nr:hypothetical protein BGZ81_009980 [Podila clonocystis]